MRFATSVSRVVTNPINNMKDMVQLKQELIGELASLHQHKVSPSRIAQTEASLAEVNEQLFVH